MGDSRIGRSSPAAAQVAPQPQTTPPPAPARDVIKGCLTAIDGRPLRRAQIRVQAPELREPAP